MLTIVLTLLCAVAFAQEPETVTLICKGELNGATELLLNFEGEVSTEIWDEDYAQLAIQIRSKGANKEVIRHLIIQKRYEIAGIRINENTYELSMPNVKFPAYVNGEEFEEEVSFHFYLPAYVRVREKAEVIAAANISWPLN